MPTCMCGAELDVQQTHCFRCGRDGAINPHLPHDLPDGLPITGRETNKE